MSVFVCSFAANAQTNYSALISFGDSLSDTGNLASATVNFPFPYYENRISNGPVAIDFLAGQLNTIALASEMDGNNFAVAGGNIIGVDVEDLGSQVSSYLHRVDNISDASALYFVMMGGNDLRGLRSETSQEAAQIVIAQLVDKLISELRRLSDAGAQQFFVANTANIGRIPETLQRESLDPGVSDRATEYTQAFNRLLTSELKLFKRRTRSNVIEYDAFAGLETILGSPSEFGFSNSTQGCFQSSDFSFHPNCIFGFRFNEFVFFDNLHPSATTHQLIGEAMVSRLIEGELDDSNPIPLNEIIMLLLDEK